MPAETTAKRDPGPLYLFCTAVLWSLGGVLSKYIPWGPLPIACFRGIIGGLLQAALTRTWHFRLTRPVVLTAVCYLGESLLIIFANKYTTAGTAIVLQNTSPLYIMLWPGCSSAASPRSSTASQGWRSSAASCCRWRARCAAAGWRAT